LFIIKDRSKVTMTTKAAGLVVFRTIDNAIQYLLLKASNGDFHWSPPKGHVDPNETDWVTALRETHEESGLVENDLEIYKDVRESLHYKVKGKPKEVVYWLARLKNATAEIKLSDEHTDYKWLGLEEAQDLSGFKDFNSLLVNFDMRVRQITQEELTEEP